MCNLETYVYKESKYTWCNGRVDEECIFKRLDRVMCNDKMQDVFIEMEVEHLVRSGSGHALMLLSFNSIIEKIIKSFRFLNF